MRVNWVQLGCFLLAGTLVLAARPAAAEQRIALVIGNSNYEFGPLKNPVNDAALMADVLREVGFEVTVEIDSSQVAMKRAIQRFGERLEKSKGVGLFYYAGHGMQSRGANYLIPIGAQIRREPDLDVEAVNAASVLTEMEFAANRLSIVILDACRNNPLARGLRSSASGLSRMDGSAGLLIAYSTAPGSTAADGDGINSPYTTALAEALRIPSIKIEEAFKRVRVAVMKATRDEQVSWESSSLTGDFIFRPSGAKAAPAAAPSASASGPVRSETMVEVAFWKSIEASANPADFQAYLNKYGNDGTFAVLARNRLGTMTQQTAVAATRDLPVSEEQQLAEALVKAQRMIKDLKEGAGSVMAATDVPFQVRMQKFRGLLGHVVDFKTMANFVLGRHRDAVTPQQWEDFFLLYQELFLSGYSFTSAKSWTGKFEMKSIRPYGPDLLVTIEAQRDEKDPLLFSLRVRRKPESFFGFKIIDATVSGLSLLVTQRDEFAPVLESQGVAGLIKSLESKIGKIEKPIDIPG